MTNGLRKNDPDDRSENRQRAADRELISKLAPLVIQPA
jgi:hypothetical protein